MLLTKDASHLLIVDMQTRLLPAMSGPETVALRCGILAQAASQLGVPVTVSEHCADKIGSTHADILQAATTGVVMPKRSFSCFGDAAMAAHFAKISGAGRGHIVICGIESHVCVLQTALAALQNEYHVFVVADAIASRRVESRDIALMRMVQAGIIPVTTEMVLFEWLERADGPAFKSLTALIR